MTAIEEPDHARAEEHPGRILIIDDNTAIHEDIRKILGSPTNEDAELDAEAAALFGIQPEVTARTEFEIDSAFQGQEGLAMVQSALAEDRPYAMAFVDVRMPPGWDGVQTISQIWKRYPELQVVICTAYSDYSWEGMIGKLGRTDNLVILKKPFDNVEVLQLAHTLTQKWLLSRRLQAHVEGLDRAVARRTQELQLANTRLRQEMEERAETQRELALSEERFAKAFQSSPIPMFIQSLATEHLLDVNAAFLALTERSRADLLGYNPRALPLYAQEYEAMLLLAQMRERTSVRHFECALQLPGEQRRECLLSAETFDLGNETVGLVAVLDVSEQRKLESQLRHAQKLEAVGQLAAGVAHDFNNILTVIHGHTSMHLAADGLDEHIATSLRQVSNAAEKASALTRQLLAFSRKQIVQPKLLDLNETVHGVDEMLRRAIGEHIDLRCDLGNALPGIFADQANLEQVIMNLVVNARDAMPRGGTLTLHTGQRHIDAAHVAAHPQARVGDAVFLGVSDTGCGISPEVMGRIFEPFFTTKEIGKGSGLGLATVYGIVAHHEGWIEVASTRGKGAAFHVYFPASAEQIPVISSPAAPQVCGGSETILVVEDEPAVREIASEILSAHGYNVLQACDGLDALDVYSRHRSAISLVLTDIVMPKGLRGNILADRLLEQNQDLRIIFSSGYSEDFATSDSPSSRQFTFLQKPYRLDELLQKVRSCLDRN